MQTIKTILITLLLVLIIQAQTFDAVGLGLAGSYSAHSRGVRSMAWNPANLAQDRGNTFELNIVSLNLSLFNNGFSLNDYNQYFTSEGHGGFWDDSEKNAIIDLIPAGGLEGTTNLGANLLGVAYNNFGFSAQFIQSGGMSLTDDKTLYNLVLFGEVLDREYNYSTPNLFDGQAFAALKLSFGYAYPLNIDKLVPFLTDISVGANFNYFLGYGTGKTLGSEAQVQRYGALGDSVQYRARFDVMSSYSESGSPSGKGIGFDFGVSAKYKERFQFSLSFTNLLAKITWTDNTEHHVFFKADTVALNDEDDEDTSVEDDSSYAVGSFSTPLPSVMRAGASFRMLSNLTLMAEWQQGFDAYFGNSTTPRVGVAAEYYPIGWVPLRGGLAVGGRQGFQFGIGTGLHFTNFEFDLSYGMNNAMWPTASEGMFLAMGMKIQF